MTQPVKKSVELFYDVISPYAWIGFEVMSRYRNKWNIDLKLRPFLLGGIMKGSDNRPPMMVPAKGDYMRNDLHRLREYYQVPINQPKDVANTLIVKGSHSAMKLLTCVNERKPKVMEELSRELFSRVWSRDEDITTPESLLQALKNAGLSESEAAELLEASHDKAISNKLRAVTEEALSLGAFGAPTFIIEDANKKKQLLWGSDRIELLAHMLGEKYEGPLRQLAASKL